MASAQRIDAKKRRSALGRTWVALLALWLCLATADLALGAATTNAPAVPPDASAAAAQTPSDAAGSIWKERLQNFGDLLAPTTGDWINAVVVFGITGVQLMLAGLVLVMVALADQILRALMRRQIREESAKPEAAPGAAEPRRSWLKLILEAATAPVALFVWVWGVYAALSLLLAHLAGDRPSLVLKILAWANRVGGIAALFWLLFRLSGVVEVLLRQWAFSTRSKWDDVIAIVGARAVRLVVPLVAVILILPTLHISPAYQQFFKQGTSLVLIFSVGFILYQLANALEEAVLNQYRLDVKDNLEARKIYTQVKVLKKLAVVVIGIFTLASMLMVFDSVRQLGTSILASAGIAGIIVGFAAQRSIATMLAGLQIAITQPIRLDDVVIVENEWGRIEEITLTYVVVRIWDLRRLVVPINYFIEKPFQNWTRVSADLLGSIFVYVDYTVPLKALREELDRILENSKLWDRRVKVLQVTDAKQNTLELRALASAADAPTAWDLRCEVREKLVDFLQRNYPQCLPRMRAELTPLPRDEIEKSAE